MSVLSCLSRAQMNRVEQQYAMSGLSFLATSKVSTLLRTESRAMLKMVFFAFTVPSPLLTLHTR